MTDVAWYQPEDLFVAVGTHISEGAIWTSTDGTTWERVALLKFSNPAGGTEIDAVIASETGLLVIGREWLGEGTAIRAEWTSTDALSWERVEVDLPHLAAMVMRSCMDNEGFSPIRNVLFEITPARELVDWELTYPGQGRTGADNAHNRCIRQLVSDLHLSANLP